MVVRIKKGATRADIKKALAKAGKGKKKSSLKKHFGALKRGLDGMTYQNEMRRAG